MNLKSVKKLMFFTIVAAVIIIINTSGFYKKNGSDIKYISALKEEGIKIAFDSATGSFSCSSGKLGVFISDAVLSIKRDGNSVILNNKEFKTSDDYYKTEDGTKYIVHYTRRKGKTEDNFDVIFYISDKENEFTLSIDQSDISKISKVEGVLYFGKDPQLVRLKGEDNHGVFSLSVGDV